VKSGPRFEANGPVSENTQAAAGKPTFRHQDRTAGSFTSPPEIEARWQARWQEEWPQRHPESDGEAAPTPSTPVDVPPYPSGTCPWAMCATNVITDVIARVPAFCVGRRCCSRWAGTPSAAGGERPAIERGKSIPATGPPRQHRPDAGPAVSASVLSIDWDREVATAHADYYPADQWLSFSSTKRLGLPQKKHGQLDPIDQTGAGQ